MKRIRTAHGSGTALLALFVLLVLGCGPSESPQRGTFEEPNAPFSRIRYAERDLLSLNDRCPVTGTRLSPQITPVYVNGRPIGFC